MGVGKLTRIYSDAPRVVEQTMAEFVNRFDSNKANDYRS
jgi:hypothetical protein